MLSLRHASRILGTKFEQATISSQVWPADDLRGGAVSLRRVAERFSPAGAALLAFERDTGSAWSHVDRSAVAAGLRDRVADPAIMQQVHTQFCGPISIAFELARRDPRRYVETLASIFAHGKFLTPAGKPIEAEEELREAALPPADEHGRVVHLTDWLMTATLRDAENIFFDIDGNHSTSGIRGFTTWGEMEDWTRDVLGLKARTQMCISSGELAALRIADDAVRAGGVAFLNIDSALIKGSSTDDEENIGFRLLDHNGPKKGALSTWHHSEDDDPSLANQDFGYMDHWVVYLGDLSLDPNANDDSVVPISLRLWSWGREYVVSGPSAAAFTEYLYAVVWAIP